MENWIKLSKCKRCLILNLPHCLLFIRGFMKYKRLKGYYRDPQKRLKDWDEVYDYKYIKENVRTQAAR